MKLSEFLKNKQATSYDVDTGERVLYKSIVTTIMQNFDHKKEPANTRVSVYFYTPETGYTRQSVTLLDTGKINLGGSYDFSDSSVNIVSDGKYYLIRYSDNLVLCSSKSDVLYSTLKSTLPYPAKLSYYSNLATTFSAVIEKYQKVVDKG